MRKFAATDPSEDHREARETSPPALGVPVVKNTRTSPVLSEVRDTPASVSSPGIPARAKNIRTRNTPFGQRSRTGLELSPTQPEATHGVETVSSLLQEGSSSRSEAEQIGGVRGVFEKLKTAFGEFFQVCLGLAMSFNNGGTNVSSKELGESTF